jgi:excisionase family DNA binding protein
MIDPHRVYTPPEVCRETHLPKGAVYAALADGSLRSIRRGARYLIPGSAVIAFLAQLGTTSAGLEEPGAGIGSPSSLPGGGRRAPG